MSKYRFYTNFDKSLILDITEDNDGRKTRFTYSGFLSIEQAREFVIWWGEEWYWGYEGSAYATEKDGKITVFAERYNSCD